jgi:hypothetical protein
VSLPPNMRGNPGPRPCAAAATRRAPLLWTGEASLRKTCNKARLCCKYLTLQCNRHQRARAARRLAPRPAVRPMALRVDGWAPVRRPTFGHMFRTLQPVDFARSGKWFESVEFCTDPQAATTSARKGNASLLRVVQPPEVGGNYIREK